MRNSHFTKAPFPFFVYTYPTSTYKSLFEDIFTFIHPNYRSHARHFQDRLENLMPLVDVDYDWNLKREREEKEEESEMKRVKKEEEKEKMEKEKEKEEKMEEEKMEEEEKKEKEKKEKEKDNEEKMEEKKGEKEEEKKEEEKKEEEKDNEEKMEEEKGEKMEEEKVIEEEEKKEEEKKEEEKKEENGDDNMTNKENDNDNGVDNNKNGVDNNDNGNDNKTKKEIEEKDITVKTEQNEKTDVNKNIYEFMKSNEVIINTNLTKPPTTINTEGKEGWRTYEEISWKDNKPFFPILNTRYFLNALTQNETVNWMNYIFSSQSISFPVNHFINLKAIQKPLYLVLDIDEGNCTIIPDYLGRLNREKIWKDQCLMNPFPEHSADPSEFYHDEDMKKKSFEDCINREFFRKTKEGKKEECLFCKKSGSLSKQISFYSLPKCLFIHLQRASFFKIDGKSYVNHKVATAVDYPLAMDLSRYFTPEKRKSCKYELTAVICHSTQIPNSHFYVLCKDNVEYVEKWVMYDDEEIRFISNAEIVTPEAYMLVYLKQNEKKITGKDIRELILRFAE